MHSLIQSIRSLPILTCLLLFGLSACTKSKESGADKKDSPAVSEAQKPAAKTPEIGNDKVKTAAEIASEISESPDRADEILEQRGLDRAALDAMMFEIASDPKLRAAYSRARDNALPSR